ncbi:PleD family two-component system response regulator [Trichocoleus desertorum AS-A10]|uniref:PleD family two-component system response regulator n=1 Tax=Trichocoleus desertorum TaxID=1481672 RepID=UPI0032992751
MSDISTILDQRDSPLVLVVDDDVFMRLQLRRAMEQEGYQVVEAPNGEQGLEDYKHLHPDIVLLDALMPIMDGFTFCAKLQALPSGDRTPVLMITGLEDEESVAQAFAAGATDYVTKPIHWAVLRQRVKRLIQQSQLHRQLESTNQVLQRLALVDGLTQLANRRCFDQHLYQSWQRLARERVALTLILCDIDCFKAYNDTYGHQAGDDCLQQIAKTISSCARRPADLAARYGGEEFALILPSTESRGGVKVAQDIQYKVKVLQLPHNSSQASHCVTLSLGIATVVPQFDSNPSALVTLADKALYQAKAAGRNQYCTSQTSLY